MKRITVQQWLLYIVLGLSVVLLLGQLLFQNFFVDYISDIHRSNVEVAIDRTMSDLQGIVYEMNHTVSSLAANPLIVEYADTFDARLRFYMAFNQVRPVVLSTINNMNIDYLMISDITGTWYTFNSESPFGSFSTTAWRHATYTISAMPMTPMHAVNTIMILDGRAYLCSVHPVFVISPIGYVQQVGVVAAITGILSLRYVIDNFGALYGISIYLHDTENILISSLPEWDGLCLDYFLTNTEPAYMRSGAIIPEALEIIVSISESDMFPQRTTIVASLIMVAAFSLLLLLIMGMFINRYIIKPFSSVIAGTRELGERNLSLRLSPTGVTHIDELVQSINMMLGRLEEYGRRVFTTQQHLYEMEINQRETQLYLLRNQINRHFLYNSLISVKTLASSGEYEKVGEITDGIGYLLRYVTSERTEVNIFDEMEIIHQYVSIQNIRFGNSIVFETDVDDRLCEYKTLKLLVQPLVENALIHGLEPLGKGSILVIRGFLHPDHIKIEVRDNGTGIPPERLVSLIRDLQDADATAVLDGVTGIALLNIQKRIRIAYGNEYGLTIESQIAAPGQAGWTQASLKLPILPHV